MIGEFFARHQLAGWLFITFFIWLAINGLAQLFASAAEERIRQRRQLAREVESRQEGAERGAKW